MPATSLQQLESVAPKEPERPALVISPATDVEGDGEDDAKAPGIENIPDGLAIERSNKVSRIQTA